MDDDQKPSRTGSTLWLTGLSAAGKTTIDHALKCRLAEFGKVAVVLDGDVLREGLSSDLGVSREDRSSRRGGARCADRRGRTGSDRLADLAL
jgi:adenylylsulfate kinase-like enzyme